MHPYEQQPQTHEWGKNERPLPQLIPRGLLGHPTPRPTSLGSWTRLEKLGEVEKGSGRRREAKYQGKDQSKGWGKGGKWGRMRLFYRNGKKHRRKGTSLAPLCWPLQTEPRTASKPRHMICYTQPRTTSSQTAGCKGVGWRPLCPGQKGG